VIRSLRDLPGQPVFQYRAPEGDLATVTSDAVNAYIREAMGEDFSAKDFRTWAATLSAARVLRETEPATSATDAKRKLTACCRTVSGLLGNTPTVCRSSYIHPAVLEAFEDGSLAEALPGPEAKSFEPKLIRMLAQ
jgi:DNA topoisomerase I